MAYHNPQNDSDQGKLRLLAEASDSPAEACEMNPEVREVFNSELRKLAEEIVEFHPSLTQLLLSMSEPDVSNPVHGQN